MQARLEPTKVEPITRLHSNGRLTALSINIRLGWKGMAMANIIVYYDYGNNYGHKILYRSDPRAQLPCVFSRATFTFAKLVAKKRKNARFVRPKF